MINGNANEFINRIYICQDTVFLFKGAKYWFQGYIIDDNSVHMELFQVKPARDNYIWEYNGASLSEGQEAFQNAKIFDGKSFWEIENEIEWADE